MNINFVSFLNPYKFNGGGELDNRYIIKSGIELGHKIKIVSRINNKYVNRVFHSNYDYFKKPDLWILSDIFNVPSYKLNFKNNFLEQIVANEPFVHFDNAYVDICTKSAIPCLNNKNILDYNCSGCSPHLSYQLYSQSLINIFLSPLHALEINNFWKNEFIEKSFVVKPLVDTSLFYNKNIPRDIDYLYVGTISEYKGYDNIKSKFGNEKNFLFIGKNSLKESVFGKHLENIENTKLVDYYNRSKNFVHLPNWKEPMGRTVIEAALCGCNIISNENVGACSFDFDLSLKDNYLNNTKDLWEKIEKIVK